MMMITLITMIVMMMITLGMPIQLPDPSDATEQGESGTPELFRSGVLQIDISVMMMTTMMMMMTMMTMTAMAMTAIAMTMMTMMMTMISLVIIRRVGETGSEQAGPSVAPSRVL